MTVGRGKRLGHYVVEEEIGDGGMGQVFAARHAELGNEVAIKVVKPELSGDQKIVERFFAEAKAATRVKHAGIIQIFDYGRDEETGSVYFAMELLDGEALSGRLERPPRPGTEEVARIGRMIADTLGAAHEAGIVHRDLKPDNVFLVRDRLMAGGVRVKILDFGIAKLAADHFQVSVKTRTGTMMGTPYYMSPEQARGATDVDAKSDIYSLGCVLFEMACGRVPFPGQGLGEVLGAHQHVAPPAPRSLEPSLDPRLEALILRLLAKAPADRPQTMDEVAAELLAIGESAAPARASSSPGIAPTVPPSSPDAAAPPPATPTPDSVSPPRGRAGSAPALPPTEIRPRDSGEDPVAGHESGSEAAASHPASPNTTLGSATGSREVTASPPAGRRALLLGAGAVVLLAGGGSAAWILSGSDHDKARAAVSPKPEPAVKPAPKRQSAPEPELNHWVRISPPAGSQSVVLGVPAATPARISGFRPDRHVVAPADAYEIQQHEVTWAELERDRAKRGRKDLPTWAPSWVPAEAEARARLPVAGIPWKQAAAYCKRIGGDLPTEAQWEYAARGEGLRPNPWGRRRLDPARVIIYRGEEAKPAEVESGAQDQTPAGAGGVIYDLAGNVREWTADLWRGNDKPADPGDEDWVVSGETTYRAVRGLPLRAKMPQRPPRHSAAFRQVTCATGGCPEGTAKSRTDIGFRCVRPAKAARDRTD